jgi:hypothetical protein
VPGAAASSWNDAPAPVDRERPVETSVYRVRLATGDAASADEADVR